MKHKLIFITLFSSIFLFAQKNDLNFQISKSTWLLGGRVNYSSQDVVQRTNVNGGSSTYSIIPNMGFAIKDNLVVGLELGFISSTTKNLPSFSFPNISEKRKFTEFAPYVTKYFPVTKKLLFNIQARFGYGYSKTRDTNPDFKFDSTIISLALMPGFAYSVSKNLIFVLTLDGLRYSNLKSEAEFMMSVSKQTQQDFGFNFQTSNFQIGFIYIFK